MSDDRITTNANLDGRQLSRFIDVRGQSSDHRVLWECRTRII